MRNPTAVWRADREPAYPRAVTCRDRRTRGTLLSAAAAACALATASPAAAATITVTRADDPPLGDTTGCSLRQAVQAANTNAPVGGCAAGETALDTIPLAASVQLSTVGGEDANQTGDLDVLTGGPVHILGTGAAPSAISQTAADRVLSVLGGTLTLERVIVTGGSATGLTPTADGGGILVLTPGRLTLTRATVSGNSAERAGGIANGHRATGGTGGEVTIRDSTVSGNTVSAASGGGMGAGGISNINATLSIVNSTISGNATAGGRGGGVYSEALSGALATVNIVNSTVTDNAGGGGGNLHNSGNGGIAAMRLRSSVVSAPRLTRNCGSSGGGSFTSIGFNMADDASCRLVASTDRPDTDPLLGPLVPGEGGTAVHIPPPGSPAIDAGTSDTALPGVGPLSADQRGLTRPVDFAEVANATAGDGTDVGAVEVQRPPASPASPASPAPPPGPVVTARDTVFAPRLAVARRPRLDGRRRVLLRVTCPRTEQSPPCRGTATLRTRLRLRVGSTRRVVVLATAPFTIGAGRTATLRLPLTSARTRLVSRLPAARRAIVIVTAADAAGNRKTLRRGVQLLPPRPAR